MRRVLALGLAAATLAGCTLEPHYVRPNPAVPGAWPTGPAYPPASAGALPSVSYPDVFKDPHLQAIIAQALTNGQDLRVAMANVEIAHAQYVVQRADLFPQINAGAGGTESDGRVTTVNPNGTTSSQRKSVRSYDASIGFSAFELDLFGRIRSLSHAAQDRYFGTEAGARAARLTLVGEVAQAYFTLAAACWRSPRTRCPAPPAPSS